MFAIITFSIKLPGKSLTTDDNDTGDHNSWWISLMKTGIRNVSDFGIVLGGWNFAIFACMRYFKDRTQV